MRTADQSVSEQFRTTSTIDIDNGSPPDSVPSFSTLIILSLGMLYMAFHEAVPEPTEYPDPATTDHVTYNPPFAELRELSADDEVTTEYESPSYVSDYRSRSADMTANAVDDEFGDDDYDVFARGVEWVNNSDNDVVCVDRVVGSKRVIDDLVVQLLVTKVFRLQPRD